jgi:hypothetical protein
VFFLWYACLCLIYCYQHKPKPDVYHLISSHPCVPEPTYWHNLMQSLKANTIFKSRASVIIRLLGCIGIPLEW